MEKIAATPRLLNRGLTSFDSMTPIPFPARERLLEKHFLRFWGVLSLLALIMNCSAQKPIYRDWNVGLGVGTGVLNGYSGLPHIRGHFHEFSLEVAPYPFHWGVGATYRFINFSMFSKLNCSWGASLVFSKENDLYYQTLPWKRLYSNRSSLSALTGPEIHFLKRCSLQGLLGCTFLRWWPFKDIPMFLYTSHGPDFNSRSSFRLNLEAGFSLDVKLFNHYQ